MAHTMGRTSHNPTQQSSTHGYAAAVVLLILLSYFNPAAASVALEATGAISGGVVLRQAVAKSNGNYLVVDNQNPPVIIEMAVSGSTIAATSTTLTLSGYTGCYRLAAEPTGTYIYALCTDGTDTLLLQVTVSSLTVTSTYTVVTGTTVTAGDRMHVNSVDGGTIYVLDISTKILYKITASGNTLTGHTTGGWPLTLSGTSILSGALASSSNIYYVFYLSTNAYISYIDLSAGTVTETTAAYDITSGIGLAVNNWYGSYAYGDIAVACNQVSTAVNVLIWSRTAGLIKAWDGDGLSNYNMNYCDSITGDGTYIYIAVPSRSSDTSGAAGGVIAIRMSDGAFHSIARSSDVFPTTSQQLSSYAAMNLDNTKAIFTTWASGSPPTTHNILTATAVASDSTSSSGTTVMTDEDAETAGAVMTAATSVAVAATVAMAGASAVAASTMAGGAAGGAGGALTGTTAAGGSSTGSTTGSSLTDVVSMVHAVTFIYIVASVDAAVPSDYVAFANSLGWASFNVVPPFDTEGWTTTTRRLASATIGLGGSKHHEYWIGGLFYFTLAMLVVVVLHACCGLAFVVSRSTCKRCKRALIALSKEFSFPRIEIVFVMAAFPGIALATARAIREGDALWSTLACIFFLLVLAPISVVPALVFVIGKTKYGLKFKRHTSGCCPVRMLRDIAAIVKKRSCMARELFLDIFCCCIKYHHTRELAPELGEWEGDSWFVDATDVFWGDKTAEGAVLALLGMPLALLQALIVGVLVGLNDDGFTQRSLLVAIAGMEAVSNVVIQSNVAAYKNVTDAISAVCRFFAAICIMLLPSVGTTTVAGINQATLGRALYSLTIIPLSIRILTALKVAQLLWTVVHPADLLLKSAAFIACPVGLLGSSTTKKAAGTGIVSVLSAAGLATPSTVVSMLQLDNDEKGRSQEEDPEKSNRKEPTEKEPPVQTDMEKVESPNNDATEDAGTPPAPSGYRRLLALFARHRSGENQEATAE